MTSPDPAAPRPRVHVLTLRPGGAREDTARRVGAVLAEAFATAVAGRLEDAFYQADELLKDAQREYRPDDPAIARVRRTVSAIEEAAREDPGQRSGGG